MQNQYVPFSAPQQAYQYPPPPPVPYGAPMPYGYGAPPPLRPVQKTGRGRAALWCVSGAVAIIIVSVFMFAVWGGVAVKGKKKEVPNIPEASSYAEDYKLPSAPTVKPDVNGPQISSVDSEEDQSVETKIASEAYDRVYESIVCITSYKSGKDYTLDAIGEGSGIIITEDGYIATNSHVVDDSTKTGVMVTLSNDKQYLGAIVGIDEKTDLAVIKIDAAGLKAAEFADSDNLKVGQQAFAIGNPGGSAFSNSMTQGSISAVNRILDSGYIKYIQTDAAINPGNSGGALINEQGQVIGINTAKIAAVEFEGMGFAIPGNTVIDVVNKLIKYGYVNDRGTLGIEGKSCTLYMSKANGIPQGMMITKINSESPLYSTDAKKDDIIVSINGEVIKSSIDLIDELSKYKPGDTVKLKLYRPSASNEEKPYTFEVSVKLISDTEKEDK